MTTRLFSVALVFQILLCMPLWTMQSRSFLAMSVMPIAQETIRFVSPYFLFVLLISLIGRVWRPEHNALRWFAVSLLFILILLDLHRLQVWVWFYLLWFVFFEDSGKQGYRWLGAAMYTWAALNKVNIHFFQSEFVEWVEPFGVTTDGIVIYTLGTIAIGIELAIGISLLFGYRRIFFLVLVWMLHLFILVFLSCVLNWNSVVLPWNLVLPIVYTLWFYAKPEPMPKRTAAMIGASLAGGAPILYSLGLWPYTLSWMLYSGLQTELTFCANKDFTKQISQKAQPHVFTVNGETFLVWHEWTFAEAAVPPFVHQSTIHQQSDWWCAQNLRGDQYTYLLSHERFCDACSDLKRTNCTKQPQIAPDIGFHQPK